jgi:hypothetical protein
MDTPNPLYHYCSNSTFCSIVNGRSIWLSSLSMSNDSMEGRWLRGVFERECLQAGINAKDTKEVLTSFDFLLGLTDGLGFCLSEADDMLSQWRGYASNGEGVSIGFRREYLEEGKEPVDNVSGYRLRKISYGDMAEKQALLGIVSEIKEASEKGLISFPGLLTAPTTDEGWDQWRKRSFAAKSQVLLLIGDLFTVKNPAFKEELEWRLLSLDIRKIDMDVQFRSAGNSIVPYRVYPLEVAKNPIVRVVIGARNQSNERDIARLLKQNGFGDVEVLRSSASYR